MATSAPLSDPSLSADPDADTRCLWQTTLSRSLNPESVGEIRSNVVAFFGILAEWSATGSDGDHRSAKRDDLEPEEGLRA